MHSRITFWRHVKVSSVHTRHLESNTNTVVLLLNVTLSLDTDKNHIILDHRILMSSIENGMSHCTSNADTRRGRVKKIFPVSLISCTNFTSKRTLTTRLQLKIRHMYVINTNNIYTTNSRSTFCKSFNNDGIIRTNLQLNVWIKVNCVRKIETKVQGFGPRTSQTSPVRIPVINGGQFLLTPQSTPI